MKRLIGVAISLLLLGNAPLSVAQDTCHLPRQLNVQSGLIVMPAAVNGSLIGVFVIDTGAEASSISHKMANKIDAYNGDVVGIKGMTGTAMVEMGQVKSIQIIPGKVHKNHKVIVQDIPNEPMLAGVIGMDILKQYTIIIDHGRMCLEE